MVNKAQFKVGFFTSKTKDDEIVNTPVSKSIEEPPTMSLNYYLALDRVSMQIVLPQRYDYVGLICYALDVDKGFQD